MAPILSLIVGGRNDSYMGDFPWRLATAINFLGDSLASFGALHEVELVVCDWGSDIPLHQVLELNPNGRAIARFIVVPPEFARAEQKDSPFPIPIIQNIAIRRSRGEFIAQTDSDILFRAQTLQNLLSVLRGERSIGTDITKTLMVCSRRHVPCTISSCYPSVAELNRYLDQHGSMLPYEPLMPGFATPSGLALLHRSVWEECQGYNETLIYWGWMEIDLYLRLTQRMPWVDLDNFGVDLFHIEHYPHRGHGAQTRKMNPMELQDSFAVTGTSWGYAESAFPISSSVNSSRKSPASAAEWRELELQKRGPAGITHELLQTEWLNKALQNLRTIQQSIVITPELLRNLELYEQVIASQQQTRTSWDFRSAVAWAAETLKPLQYLEIGMGRTEASILTASLFKPVSIVGVGSWRNFEARVIPRPEIHSECLAKKIQHAGYVRYISGNVADNLSTIPDLLMTQASFDLITVGAIDAPHEIDTSLLCLMQLLARGGVAIMGFLREDTTNFAYNKIIKTYPGLTVLQSNTALLLWRSN